MKRKKKWALTLLEVAIAIFITGILLSLLWGLYHQWCIASDKIQKTEARLYRVLFIKHRLEDLCLLVANPKEKNFVFTLEEKNSSLCFSYKSKVDRDPIFNQTLRSLLYVDNKAKTLCLCTFANEKQSRIEILLDKVISCEFSFFDPQTHLWRFDWTEDLDHLPLWMKMQWKTQEEKETLLFRLSYPEEPILYFDMLRKEE